MEITAAQGGHAAAVQALLPVNPSGQQPLLLSADWEGALKVWDMHTGGCVQTLPGAHAHVVMGLLQWEARPAAPASTPVRGNPVAVRGRYYSLSQRSATGRDCRGSKERKMGAGECNRACLQWDRRGYGSQAAD